MTGKLHQKIPGFPGCVGILIRHVDVCELRMSIICVHWYIKTYIHYILSSWIIFHMPTHIRTHKKKQVKYTAHPHARIHTQRETGKRKSWIGEWYVHELFITKADFTKGYWFVLLSFLNNSRFYNLSLCWIADTKSHDIHLNFII